MKLNLKALHVRFKRVPLALYQIFCQKDKVVSLLHELTPQVTFTGNPIRNSQFSERKQYMNNVCSDIRLDGILVNRACKFLIQLNLVDVGQPFN